jgi:hypothetical protein
MRLPVLSVAIAVCLSLQAMAQTAPMDCTVGPITKTIGGSKWLVGSCSDDRTMTLMAMDDSPAYPCFIVVAPSPEGYKINARGNGDQQATKAAMAELASLSVPDIHSLIAETKQQQKPK